MDLTNDISHAQPHAAENVDRRMRRWDKLKQLTKKSSLPSNLDTLHPGTLLSPLPLPSGHKHPPPPPPSPPPPPPPHPSQPPHALGDSQPLSLAAFAQRYSNHLPAEIVVTKGGSYSHVTLNCEDTLEVHQIRELCIVHSTTNDGKQLKIPLNSPIEFCMLYDPENNISKTIRGYTFERVSDLISATPRPRLVCARSTWEGKADNRDGSRVVIDDREVLVVGEVVLPAKKKKKMHLRTYSITKQVEKVLPEDCVGNFSTKPVLLPLYLPEVTGYVRDPFPCKAVVQEVGLVVQPGLADLVRELSGRVLTLTAMTKEVALVTTLAKGADNDGSCYPVITEVPVNMPQIQVSVLSFTCEKEVESETTLAGASSSSTETKDEERKDQDTNSQEDEHYEIMSSARLWDMSGSLASTKPRSSPPLPPPPPRPAKMRPSSSFAPCNHLPSPPPPPSSFIDVRPMSPPPTLPPPPLVPGRPTLTDPPPPQTSTPRSRGSVTCEPLSPGELVEHHGHALPVQVKVVRGHHAPQCTLLRDEVYRIHLLTSTEGVSMSDEKGSLFLVPMHSALLFGVVFNPFNDFQSAMRGYTFDTVLDIVSSRQLPCVLGATSPHRGPSPEESVEPGEVLIVNKVERAGEDESVLVVYSFSTMATKRLSGDCKGGFTTSPASVKLTLARILEHVPSVLPTCAVAYGDLSPVTAPTRPAPPPEQANVERPSSPLLPHPPIFTLLKRHPKGVLVATVVLSQKAIWNPYAPIEIPLHLPVEVVLAPRGVRRVTAKRSRPRSQCITQGFQVPRGSSSPDRHEDRDKLPALPPKYYQQLLRVPYQVSVYQRIIRSMADQALQGVKGHLSDTTQGVDLHQNDAGKLLHQGDTDLVEDAENHRGDEGERTSLSVAAVYSSSDASTTSSSPANQLAVKSPGRSKDVLPAKPTLAIGTRSTSCEQLEGSIKVLGGGGEDVGGGRGEREGEGGGGGGGEGGSAGGGGGGSGQLTRGGALVKPRSLSDQSSSQMSSELTSKSLSVSSQLSCEDQPVQGELNDKVMELTRHLAVLTAQLGNLQETINTMNRCLSVSSGWGQCGPHTLTGYNENQRFLASLTSTQVLHLLDAVGLSIHKEQFEREGVDGRLLCKCSDQVLRDDLKMASQLHRLKLLSFISGEVNVVGHLTPPLQNGTA